MRNIVHNSWVKNVYNTLQNLWVRGGLLYTGSYTGAQNTHPTLGQPVVIHPQVPYLPTALSTVFSGFSYLLQGTYAHNPQALLLRKRSKKG